MKREVHVLRNVLAVCVGGMCQLIPTGSLIAWQATFPYHEKFDDGTAPEAPPGWQLTGFLVSTTSPRSSPTSLRATGNTSVKSITTPAFDFTGKLPQLLTFYERRSNTALPYRLRLLASTDGFSTTVVLASFDSISATATYVPREVDLTESELAGLSDVRFRWELVADGTNSTGAIQIDDVTITVATEFDISLRSVSVQPHHPTADHELTVVARVHNEGLHIAEDWKVAFFRDPVGALRSNDPFAVIPGSPLNPSDSLNITAFHDALPVGQHSFRAVVLFSGDQNPGNDTARVTTEIGPAPGSVVINEIMYYPVGDEPEWIELVNVSGDTMNLKGWRISDDRISTKTLLTGSDILIQPGGYVLVVKDTIFFAVHTNPGVPVIIAPFSALNNSTPDAVVLYDNRLATIDSILYFPSWGGQNGRSLERIDTEDPSTDSTNWKTSRDPAGRTPGRQNSIARLGFDLELLRLEQGSGSGMPT
ncbi:MAG: lamin tail domain-containing protein, partial [Bacteroidota bacterium]